MNIPTCLGAGNRTQCLVCARQTWPMYYTTSSNFHNINSCPLSCTFNLSPIHFRANHCGLNQFPEQILCSPRYSLLIFSHSVDRSSLPLLNLNYFKSISLMLSLQSDDGLDERWESRKLCYDNERGNVPEDHRVVSMQCISHCCEMLN